MERAIYDGTVFGEELAPVGEELRVVVEAGAVGFQAGAQVDLQAVWVLARDFRSGGRIRDRRCGVSCGRRLGLGDQ